MMGKKLKKSAARSAPIFCWDPAATPEGIARVLRALSEKYPIKEGAIGTRLDFQEIKEAGICRIKNTGAGILIEYSRPNMAIRAVGALLSGIDRKEEFCPFSTVGVMIDCSRNAVPTVGYLKTYIGKLALLGFNTLLLYTEDTYQIEGEPHFGYMRGVYTEVELREIDRFASENGVEMIPCIQTLGHLEQILRWPAFRSLKDTDDVLLVDEKKTYELVEKMIALWSRAFRSRRIHIGMDETHAIGRGRFYDLHGDERHFDIFNRHLGKVVGICQKHGLQPMIWSDMYFRMGNQNNEYYARDTVIPEDVAAAIPKEISLVYWDYYHEDKEFYREWIERHRQLGKEPIMASGVWTGNKFWYDRHITEKIVQPCMEACRESGIKEVIFTMWGDDGILCDPDSAFAGLAYAAEMSFAGEASNSVLNAKLKALFDGSSYEDIRAVSEIERKGLFPASTLWDDPLMLVYLAGVKFRELEAGEKFFENAIKTCTDIIQRLGKSKARGSAGDLVLAKALARAVAAKFALADALISGYLAKDRKALEDVMPLIADYGRKLRKLVDAYRTLWHRNYKPFGFETMQIRFAGQEARLGELSFRLREYLDGKVETIPELEEIQRVKGEGSTWRYKNVSHGSVIL